MKIVSAAEAVAHIRDGSTITTGGGVGIGFPELVVKALGTSGKKDLTLFHAAGQGDGKDRGLNHLATPGLLKRVIGGHWGLAPKLQALANTNAIEAYNLPQGVASHLFRDIAAHRPGHLTTIGINTFIDPILGGGRLNAITTEDIVQNVTINGKECLFYPAFPIDVALIRATTSDKAGNLTMEGEALTMDTLSQAMAARNSGGIVIAQVRNIREANVARSAHVPAHLVDYVVVCDKLSDHPFTFGSNESHRAKNHDNPSHQEMLIARRALQESKAGDVVNVGIGLAGYVVTAAGLQNQVTFTTESGATGGVPLNGLNFGASAFNRSVVDQGYQFDFYDGGGIDVAFLGFAEIDRHGNVNVSRFKDRIAGAGGFINITQRAKKIVFCGTMLSSKGEKKFVNSVEQVTFRADNQRDILCVTDKAVFRLSEGDVRLDEVFVGVSASQVLDNMEFIPVKLS